MTQMRKLKPSQLRPGLLYDITASNAVTSSYALTSSYSTPNYLIITGSIFAQVNTNGNIFLIQSSSQPILTVSSSNVLVLATSSIELTGSAPIGGMYFTSGSFFVGLP